MTGITDEQVERGSRAYQEHFERYVIFIHGHGAANVPSSVVDEQTGETVYGPTTGWEARDWNYKQATKAALIAALGSSEHHNE